MYNLPEDIHLYCNEPMSPLYNEDETYCYSCGSSMVISSFDKDMLECENESCEVTIDLSDTGKDDW